MSLVELWRSSTWDEYRRRSPAPLPALALYNSGVSVEIDGEVEGFIPTYLVQNPLESG